MYGEYFETDTRVSAELGLRWWWAMSETILGLFLASGGAETGGGDGSGIRAAIRAALARRVSRVG